MLKFLSQNNQSTYVPQLFIIILGNKNGNKDDTINDSTKDHSLLDRHLTDQLIAKYEHVHFDIKKRRWVFQVYNLKSTVDISV